MSKSGKQYTLFQLFVLAYLASEESKQREKEQTLNDISFGHHSHTSVLPHSVKTNLFELSSIIPPSMIPEKIDMQDLYHQLEQLETNDLLTSDRTGYLPEYQRFSITPTGNMVIRRYFSDLVNKVKNKKVYEEIIEMQEGSADIKNYLKGLWNKFKDKSQDEIASLSISEAKRYGPVAISFLINLISQTHDGG